MFQSPGSSPVSLVLNAVWEDADRSRGDQHFRLGVNVHICTLVDWTYSLFSTSSQITRTDESYSVKTSFPDEHPMYLDVTLAQDPSRKVQSGENMKKLIFQRTLIFWRSFYLYKRLFYGLSNYSASGRVLCHFRFLLVLIAWLHRRLHSPLNFALYGSSRFHVCIFVCLTRLVCVCSHTNTFKKGHVTQKCTLTSTSIWMWPLRANNLKN